LIHLCSIQTVSAIFSPLEEAAREIEIELNNISRFFLVYANGEVCISILHAPGDDPNSYESASERWSPVQSVEKILLSVISMLAGKASLSLSFYKQKITHVLSLSLSVCVYYDLEPNLESGANIDACVSLPLSQ
jgi:hypothetical protein